MDAEDIRSVDVEIDYTHREICRLLAPARLTREQEIELDRELTALGRRIADIARWGA
jgi:hypothetical protein